MENNYKEKFKNICKNYKFKYVENSENEISLCAKNTDREWVNWITLDLKQKKTILIGNTDQCNLWFYKTRKDMNPEKIIGFVAELNNILREFNDSYIMVKTIIDPEDWQEIAQIRDAYKDDRYKIQFKSIEFGNDNYIYFTILKEGYEFEGLFRIHDPENGPDMTLVSISNCCVEKDQEFFNAHWEEIENELCKIVGEKQIIKEEKEEEIT